MIDNEVLKSAPALRSKFQNAKPFKHLCIDDFFLTNCAENLLTDFPGFEARNALNEFGAVGGKAVVTTLKDISPFYARVYEYVMSREFLDTMTAITGIPDLLPDPRMYGGGTHENLHDQELDPHVDFNYDLDHGYHRRLNLILYLNKGWREDWGGAIELHSNPRRPQQNEVQAFNCAFNRAVIFETNEYSWHGFKKIRLPAQERHQSRKSLSIYLYTRERPPEEIAPPHGTFYVPRPLDFQLRASEPLTPAQVAEIEAAIKHRDRWIEHYQDLEVKLSGQAESRAGYARQLLSATKAPVTGIARPCGDSIGIFPDGWVAKTSAFSALPRKKIAGFVLHGQIPQHFPRPVNFEILVDGTPAAKSTISDETIEIQVHRAAEAWIPLRIEIRTDKSFNAAAQGVGPDARDLSFVLYEVEFFGP